MALVLFFWWELRQAAPLIDLRLFRLPNVLTGALIASFNHVGIVFIVFIAMFLQRALGYSPLMAGVLLLPMLGLGVVFSNLGGYLSDKFGVKLPLLLATGFLSLGCLLTLLWFSSMSYAMLLPLLVGSGIGTFMISVPVRNALLSQVEKLQYGMANALLTGVRSILSVIGFALSCTLMGKVEWHVVSSQLLDQLPHVTTAQIEVLLGLLAKTPQSQAVLSTFSSSQQAVIHQIVFNGYVTGFFWGIVFISILMLTNFLLTLFFIKQK